MFDDRLVFESPGKLPGQVKPNNIWHTHFSRNPKIAAFLKAYHFVKEFGEGFDRICREQEANGANVPSFLQNRRVHPEDYGTKGSRIGDRKGVRKRERHRKRHRKTKGR